MSKVLPYKAKYACKDVQIAYKPSLKLLTDLLLCYGEAADDKRVSAKTLYKPAPLTGNECSFKSSSICKNKQINNAFVKPTFFFYYKHLKKLCLFERTFDNFCKLKTV